MPTYDVIFDALAQEGVINLSDAFQDVQLIWMESIGLPLGIQIETTFAIQVYVSPTEVRTFPLNEDAFIDTNNLILIPDEFRGSGWNQRLAILVEQDVQLRIHALKTECCGQAKLDEINTKLNLLLAEKALNFVSNIALVLAGGTPIGQLLLAANQARKWFTIFNPSSEPVLINLGQPATTTDFLFELAPGATYRETDFIGDVFAVSKTGNPVELKIGEF
jgi:hypothetical protein